MLIFAAALAAQGAALAPAPSEDVVVIARRTGVPVWRVRQGNSTLVMVGTITDIAKGARWNVPALEATVARADRVMFPQSVALGASPFQLVGWIAKWKRMSTLPRGQSLSAMLSAGDRQRLNRLAAQGLAPRKWDRVHPLHLAFKMHSILRKRTGIDVSANSVVKKAMRRHKVAATPIFKGRASPVIRDLFASSPAEHLPCLEATLTMSEAGPAELRRRSRAWANREVSAAIRTPLAAVETRCWPAVEDLGLTADLLATSKSVLSRGGTTVAIINLDSLARRGGLLDRLKSSGVVIDGPDWR